MRLRSGEFKISPIVSQKFQSERDDLLYTNQIVKLPSKLLKSQLSLCDPFNSLTFYNLDRSSKSLHQERLMKPKNEGLTIHLSFCNPFSYLPSKSRFLATPKADITNTIIIVTSDKLIFNEKLSQALPAKALKKYSFVLAISTAIFKSLHIIRAFISADHIFDAIKRFRFDVVVKPRFKPVRITPCSPIINSLMMSAKQFSQFFISKTSFFKQSFISFFIHHLFLYYYFVYQIIPFITHMSNLLLTKYYKYDYNCDVFITHMSNKQIPYQMGK